MYRVQRRYHLANGTAVHEHVADFHDPDRAVRYCRQESLLTSDCFTLTNPDGITAAYHLGSASVELPRNFKGAA